MKKFCVITNSLKDNKLEISYKILDYITKSGCALVEEGDLIEIDVMERKLNIIGIAGERKSMEEIDQILAERRKNWKPREMKYKKGVLRLFSQHAASPMKGAYLEY